MLPKVTRTDTQNDTMQSRYQGAGIFSQGIAYDGSAYSLHLKQTAIRKLKHPYVLIDSNTNAAKNVGVKPVGNSPTTTAGSSHMLQLLVVLGSGTAGASAYRLTRRTPVHHIYGHIRSRRRSVRCPIDAATGYAYVSSYCSNVVHKIDINNGWARVGTIIPAPAFKSTQGIAYDNNHLRFPTGARRCSHRYERDESQTILPINSISGLELEGLYVDAHIIMVVNKPIHARPT